MHLKKITLYNFKSYVGFTVIDNIPSNLTAFVGKNGVGKSNIFQAIQFVLTKETKADRWKELLSIVSARKTDGYIELVFSNCDELGDFAIKKTFSLKKSRRVSFYVNGIKENSKVVSKLLDVCGFQFYKPIFIIDRFMVLNFLQLSSEGKLNFILKNLGAVFNETYHTITKLFHKFEDQKELLDHLLDVCTTEINIDKERYISRRKTMIKSKLCIVYSLCNKKICVLEGKKNELQKILQSKFDVEDFPFHISNTLSDLKKQLSEISDFTTVQENKLHDFTKEEIDLIGKNEKISLKLKTYKTELEFLKQNNASSEDTHKYSAEHYATGSELDNIKTVLQVLNTKCVDLKSRLTSKEKERLHLLYKIEKEEELMNNTIRLNELKERIRLIDEQKKILNVDLTKLSQMNLKSNNKKDNLFLQIDNLKKSSIGRQDEDAKDLYQYKQELNILQNELSDLQRKENSLNIDIQGISKNIDELILKLRKRVGKNIIQGSENVRRIIEDWKSSGSIDVQDYFGMVIENIICSSGLYLAVETAIGNRLFSHIVKDNHYGTLILNEMKQCNLPGEVWFIPMKNIIVPDYNYSPPEKAEPLINKLEYSPVVRNAMRFLFGGIMLCPDLKTAAIVAKTGFTCVTVQGDRISSKCDFYGGYVDPFKSSILMFTEVNKVQNEFISKTEMLENILTRIHDIDPKLTDVISKIQKIKTYLNSNTTESKIENMKREIQIIDNDLLANEERINNLIHIEPGLEQFKEILEKEMTQPFEPFEFISKLQNLNEEIVVLKKDINAATFKIYEKTQEKKRLEEILILSERKINFNNSGIISLRRLEKYISEANIRQSLINRRLLQVKDNISTVKENILKVTNNKISLTDQLNKLKEFKMNNPKDTNIEDKNKILSKIKLYETKILSYQSLIEDIKNKCNIETVLPKNLSNLAEKLLQEKLVKVCKDIKKLDKSYCHGLNGSIDSSVLERFEIFDSLFNKSYVCFSQFIEYLHDFIETKLEQVSSEYTQIFNKIFPGAESFIIAESDDSSNSWPALPSTTGINICVGWPGGDVTWNLGNLSYGNKICIVLALAFSMVNVSSVPLMILDEIIMALSDREQRLFHEIVESYGNSLQIFSSAHTLESARNAPSIFKVGFGDMGSSVTGGTNQNGQSEF